MSEAIGLKINDPLFWDRGDLRKEVDRIFDICHSCRLCFKFCGSFPAMFEVIDGRTERMRQEYLAEHPEIASAAERRRREAAAHPQPAEETDAEAGVTYGDELPELSASAGDLSDGDVDRVVDLCFQCKLCYPNCPYTPPHEFAVDFPRLLLRWKAQRTRQQGVSWRTKLMRDTVRIGKVSSVLPSLTNRALDNRLNRTLMEKVLGIHRDKRMPEYHAETFPRWWSQHRPALEEAEPPREDVEATTPMRVALFSTCLVDYNDPDCGRAAVRVLEHNGVEVRRPEKQVCCGMPFLDGGDVEAAAAKARQNVEAFLPLVEQGYAVVLPSPSCSLMVREEYPQLLADQPSARLAEHSHDLNLYLYCLAREGRLKRDFQRRFERIRYHVPCHLRVQNIGIRGRDLLRLVADEVETVQECTGHDGTWSMQKEHFADSLRWGQKAFAGMRPNAAERGTAFCTDCRLAALHLRQGAGCATVHPVVALAEAYGLEAGGSEPLTSQPVEP